MMGATASVVVAVGHAVCRPVWMTEKCFARLVHGCKDRIELHMSIGWIEILSSHSCVSRGILSSFIITPDAERMWIATGQLSWPYLIMIAAEIFRVEQVLAPVSELFGGDIELYMTIARHKSSVMTEAHIFHWALRLHTHTCIKRLSRTWYRCLTTRSQWQAIVFCNDLDLFEFVCRPLTLQTIVQLDPDLSILGTDTKIVSYCVASYALESARLPNMNGRGILFGSVSVLVELLCECSDIAYIDAWNNDRIRTWLMMDFVRSGMYDVVAFACHVISNVLCKWTVGWTRLIVANCTLLANLKLPSIANHPMLEIARVKFGWFSMLASGVEMFSRIRHELGENADNVLIHPHSSLTRLKEIYYAIGSNAVRDACAR